MAREFQVGTLSHFLNLRVLGKKNKKRNRTKMSVHNDTSKVSIKQKGHLSVFRVGSIWLRNFQGIKKKAY